MRWQLPTLDDEISTAEHRLVAAKIELGDQAGRTHRAVKHRLSRPDALLMSAGLGALYGLWTTRPAGKRKEGSQQRSTRTTAISGWLVRTALSMMATHLFSASSTDEVHANEAVDLSVES